MDRISRNEKWIFALIAVLCFVCMFAFFYCMHPIVILDSDDWQYVSYVRPAVPYTGFWNPARILPEILMPFCGTVAAVIYRFGFLGYIESQILVFAVTISLFISFYVLAFSVLIKKKFSLKMSAVAFISAFFLILHFLIFRTEKQDNLYMFWSYDATCYFYYTIPSLLCCTLVMYFESSGILEDFFSKDNLLMKSVTVVALYFAIFSNLFNSAILAIYMGYEIIKSRKIKLLPALIIVLWGISMVFEALGGRGSSSVGGPRDLSGAFSYLITDFSSFSIFFEGVMLLIIAAALIIFTVFKKKNNVLTSALKKELFAFFFISIFEVLLCAKVNTLYMLRPQVFFGIGFSIFMMICLCLAYIIKEVPQSFIAVPIMTIVMLSVTNTQEITFAESNTMNLPWQTCVKIDNDIISQIVCADKNGETDMTLDVMDTGVDDNWPHSDYIVYGIEQSLYKHGLISKHINITPHWSLDFNERNGLNITEFSENRY